MYCEVLDMLWGSSFYIKNITLFSCIPVLVEMSNATSMGEKKRNSHSQPLKKLE
jgi:hypothetical protein